VNESSESSELQEVEPDSVAPAPLPAPAPMPSIEEQYANAQRAFRRRNLRPLLGPTLVASGVLLWAYVVFGDLVIGVGFPDGLAVVIVLAIFVLTGYASGRQSLAMLPAASASEQRRLLLPAFGALGLTLATVLFVSVFARAGRPSGDGPVVLLLLALGFGAATYGYHLSGPNLLRPGKAIKGLILGARLFGALLTIVVIAHALSSWR